MQILDIFVTPLGLELDFIRLSHFQHKYTYINTTSTLVGLAKYLIGVLHKNPQPVFLLSSYTIWLKLRLRISCAHHLMFMFIDMTPQDW